jgi:hypothetical protein
VLSTATPRRFRLAFLIAAIVPPNLRVAGAASLAHGRASRSGDGRSGRCNGNSRQFAVVQEWQHYFDNIATMARQVAELVF